jgi:protein-disulfide isomerase
MKLNCLSFLVVIFCVINPVLIKAQETDSIHIDGVINVNVSQVKTAQLMKYTPLGDMEVLKGSVNADGKHFHFSVPPDIKPGMYFVKTEGMYMSQQVIITGDESEIAFNYSQVRDDDTPNAHFISSEQNIAYNNYIYHSNQLLRQCSTLLTMRNQISLPPVKENLKIAVDTLTAEYKRLYNEFCRKYAGTPAGTLVSNDPHRIEYNYMSENVTSPEVQSAYWNGIDTSNPFLMNSDLYYNHVYTYLMYYFVQSQKEQKAKKEYDLQRKLESATDTIMEHFRSNEAIRTDIITYLETMYMDLGQTGMLQFVHENYIQNELCTDELSVTEAGKQLQKQIEGLKFTAPGQPAYDIALTGKDGKIKGLKDLPGDKVLVIFWNTSCNHCTEQMPKVEKYLELQGDKKAITVAVCVSTDEKAYHEMIKKYPAMLHVHDTGEKTEKLVESYYVYGTPTFFLLDKKRNFIGTYYSWDSVKGKLQ